MFTKAWKILLTLNLLCSFTLAVSAQRNYKSQSVLATGTWYRVSVPSAGIYKIEASLLSSMGFGSPVSSSQIRIYGKRTPMLPESNAAPYTDDLEELAIQVSDGGDGSFSGADFLLFYSQGPHVWGKDSVNKRFTHQYNLYSEVVYYYITVGGSGKRIQPLNLPAPAPMVVTSFDERYFHELDSVNFLNSGKEWYGEEMSNLPGRSLTRNFSLPAADIVTGQTATVVASVVARSLNTPSLFNLSLNNAPLGQLPVPPLGGGLFDLFGQAAQGSFTTSPTQNRLDLAFTYQPGSFNSQGWLNWFEVFYRKTLRMVPGEALHFRDWNSVGNSQVKFSIANANDGAQVWEITDPMNPYRLTTSISSGTLEFRNDASRLREYVAFIADRPAPTLVGKVENQDLHQATETDYLIVTPEAFLPQAQRIAAFHTSRNLRVKVATTAQIFHEFSAGIPDPTAIRDFVKMYYDRFQSSWGQGGKYLMLLGRGSFDYKDRVKNNTNLVPVFENNVSLDPLSTYTSDDFFGFLDDHEDINSGMVTNLLDIGIGRIPARSAEEAAHFANKLEAYHSPAAFGPWRTHLNFVADDEDQNLHLQDAEIITASVHAVAPQFNLYKFYLDAFRQEGSAAGQRYPQVNEAINNHIYNGTLIWNYSGHGGPVRLAEETILDQEMVNSWNNPFRLPLFITATCNFAPYDLPGIISLGENLIVRPKTGAIAMMSTSRVVFAYSNRIMNNNYLNIALQPDSNGRYKTLGEAAMAAKNFTYQTSGDITNNRKFSLLGDPAMTLAYPRLQVVATEVNDQAVSVADTLSATELVKIEGEVRDPKGNFLAAYNGTVYLSLYDKPQTVTTLGNDPGSQPPVNFQLQTSTLFKGKASVLNGRFVFHFRLPKDINYQFGAGKISLYATDESTDGTGFSNNMIIGGIKPGGTDDKTGPEIRAWLNDEQFVNGSITNENPVLLVKLADSSGINTGDAGVDHDIVATLDDDNSRYFVLNDFYETDKDSYQQGSLRFQLPELSPGPHKLKIKAWDAMNNSNEYILEFVVGNKDELVLDHVLNYPNPFTTRTAFWFEHNQPFTDLYAKVEIFTVTGKLIKTLTRTINSEGTRSSDIEWDGRDDYGDRIARGVYLYRLTVRTPDGKNASKLQRLVFLQ